MPGYEAFKYITRGDNLVLRASILRGGIRSHSDPAIYNRIRIRWDNSTAKWQESLATSDIS